MLSQGNNKCTEFLERPLFHVILTYPVTADNNLPFGMIFIVELWLASTQINKLGKLGMFIFGVEIWESRR